MPLSHITKGVARDLIGLYRPRGWRVSHPRSYAYGRNGICIYASRVIHCPRIVDEYTLGVFLHEVHHARHEHRSDPSHVDEYNAEMYAFEQLRHLGFTVKRTITTSAKHNVWGHVKANRAAGLKIDWRIAEWANPKTSRRKKAAYWTRRGLEFKAV